MVVTLLLGSDKITVSVATGQNDYYPLYLSIGNITNRVRRAHEDGVIVIGFLAIPKCTFTFHLFYHTLTTTVGEREDEKSSAFHNFRRQLFHSSLATILEPIRSAMTTPDVVRCPDGHFRRVIYSLGPYIADYPEQVLLSGIVSGWCPKLVHLQIFPRFAQHVLGVPHTPKISMEILAPGPKSGPNSCVPRSTQPNCGMSMGSLPMSRLVTPIALHTDSQYFQQPFTSDFPRADIHELLSCDLLHQVVKGTFKDHLVTWVEDYLKKKHGKSAAARIMSDIDRR